MAVRVYGASDDLIEVEGDLREEFNAYDLEDGAVLAFSDGTVLRAVYDDDGCWRLTRLAEGRGLMRKIEAFDLADEGLKHPGTDVPGYSDLVTLEADIEWVVFGPTFHKGKSHASTAR